MAMILEIKGENPFKVHAYENAARIVDGMSDLDKFIEEGTLTEIKGIGKNLADHIVEIYRTGRLKELDSLLKSIPAGLLDMLSIPGVGAKKVRVFFDKLKITTIGELERACQENRLRDIPGFGEKTEGKILQGIQFWKKHQGRFLYPVALAAALPIYDALKKHKDVVRLEVGGSLRRRKELVKDIDILVSAKNPKKVMEAFVENKDVAEVVQHGETKSSVMLSGGINADLRCVTDAEFPYALHHFTGSKEHNTAMRGRAKGMGLKMNEYGLFKGDRNIPCKNEEEIFKKLGLEYIPPELREDMGEIEAAEKGTLPELIKDGDVKGMLHIHSVHSDGMNTIEELARATQGLGYEYMAICDHSQSAAYAGGLKPVDIKKQHEEIEGLNKKIKGIKILKGIEVDILGDGTLDYPDKILETFDIVIASVHSRFNMKEDEMTGRICKALAHPLVDILGHPTGRLLLTRDAYQINMRKVIECAAKYKKVIELNANPQRLDIDWRHGPFVKEMGVKVAICTDAHTIDGLNDIMFGIGIARKSWYTKDDVINTKGLREFLKLLGK